MVENLFFISRGRGEVCEVPFEGVYVFPLSLVLCVERELGFWGGGGIYRSELGVAPVGLRLDSRLGVGLLVSKLPCRPRLVIFRPVLPGIIGPGEPLTYEHRRQGEEKEGFVRDGATWPAGLPLGVLEHVNVLGGCPRPPDDSAA